MKVVIPTIKTWCNIANFDQSYNIKTLLNVYNERTLIDKITPLSQKKRTLNLLLDFTAGGQTAVQITDHVVGPVVTSTSYPVSTESLSLVTTASMYMFYGCTYFPLHYFNFNFILWNCLIFFGSV